MKDRNSKKIILRADDLGYSKGVNYGIKKCVEKGTIRTIGLIVNLEHSQHGYDLIKKQGLCLGLHVNITSGSPICDPSQVPSLLNGTLFKSSKEYPCEIKYEEVYREVEKQYERFIEITNCRPDYMEGHAIMNETYLSAIKDIAKKYQILYIPTIPVSDISTQIYGKDTYFWLESMKKDYDPAKTVKRVFDLNRPGCEVIIFHPGFIDDDLMKKSSLLLPRVQEVCYLSSDALLEKIVQNPNTFITYKEI